MTAFVIGGVERELKPVNLKTIKRIWPMVSKIQNAEELPDVMDVVVNILSICLERSDTPMAPEQIEEEMLASEISGVQVAMQDFLVESGLLHRPIPGEAVGEAKSPSTEIGTE